MIDLRGMLAVFRFECSRTVTLPRLAGWGILTGFSPALLALVSYKNGQMPERYQLPNEAWWMFFFILIPEVTCLLGLLLWATPMIHSELEGRTWIYLSIRPRGKGSVLLGKYLTAMAWAGSSALVGLTISVIVTRPPDAMKLWAVYSLLIALSCLAYGSVYTLLGVAFQRRAMVLAVLYTLLLEFVVSFIPAIINKITIHYRLRGLMVRLMDFEIPPSVVEQTRFGTEEAWLQLVVLIATALTAMGLSFYLLHKRELMSEDG